MSDIRDIIVRESNSRVFKPRKNHLFGKPVSYYDLISYLNDGSWDAGEDEALLTKSVAAYPIKLDDEGKDTTISIYNEKKNIVKIEQLLSCKYYDNGTSNKIFLSLPYQKLVEYLGELDAQLSAKDEIIKRYEALIDNTFAKELYALTNTNECNLEQIDNSSTYKLVNVKADLSYIGKIVNVKITYAKTWSLDGVLDE